MPASVPDRGASFPSVMSHGCLRLIFANGGDRLPVVLGRGPIPSKPGDDGRPPVIPTFVLEQAPLLQRRFLPFRHIQPQHFLEVAGQDAAMALRGVGLVAAQDGLRGQGKDAAQVALEAFRRGEAALKVLAIRRPPVDGPGVFRREQAGTRATPVARRPLGAGPCSKNKRYKSSFSPRTGLRPPRPSGGRGFPAGQRPLPRLPALRPETVRNSDLPPDLWACRPAGNPAGR